MPLVAFDELLSDAEQGGYAVGYFECWNLESLQGVIDAAEAASSPVIVGFSGLNLPDPRRTAVERLEIYAALGRAACETARVPTALLFNESPDLDWIERAVELGFSAVMYADQSATRPTLIENVRRTVALAAGRAAVEAEISALPGVATGLACAPRAVTITDPDDAARFVEATGVAALAVSLGNIHLHGRQHVPVDLERLRAIRSRVGVPLVLHGGTSIERQSLREAIHLGISKVNVGSALRRAFFLAVRDRADAAGPDFNPYQVLGSGLAEDILLAGRAAVRDVVLDYMRVFGSAGRAVH